MSGRVGMACAAVMAAALAVAIPALVAGPVQTPGDVLWAESFGGSGGDRVVSVCFGAGDDLYVAGYFHGTIQTDVDLVSAGGSDVMIARYAGDAGPVWSRRIGNTATDEVDAIVATTDGIVISGGFHRALDLDGEALTAVGGRDAYVAMLSAQNGATQWARSFGGEMTDRIAAVAVDPAGDIIVVGYFRASIDLGGGALASAGGTDIVVAKLSAADGGHVWSQRYGADDEDRAYGVAVDANGDVVVVGYFSGTADVGGATFDSQGGGDAFVAKYAGGDGSHIWSIAHGGVGANVFEQVAVDLQGDIYVTGETRYDADFGAGLIANERHPDVVVAKYGGLDGAHSWSQTSGSTGPSKRSRVALLGNGNLLLIASVDGTADIGAGPIGGIGQKDLLVAELDSETGAPVWWRRHGGVHNELVYALALGAAGEIVIGGELRESLTLGSDTLTSAGGADGFLAALSD